MAAAIVLRSDYGARSCADWRKRHKDSKSNSETHRNLRQTTGELMENLYRRNPSGSTRRNFLKGAGALGLTFAAGRRALYML
jgi:hypothetical protein